MGISDSKAFKQGKLTYRAPSLSAPRSSGPVNPLAKSAGGWEDPKGSSYIGTADDADTSLGRAMGQAESLLANAPEDQITEDEVRYAEEVGQAGWKRALGGVMSALEFIDRGRGLISLAARDVLGQDEAKYGDDFGLDAYIDVAIGKRDRLAEKYGEDLVGRDGDLTFSSIMDDWWSHDEEDAWWDKALRGIVSFAGDVAIDPLTYVTFGASAVGVKGSIAAVDKTIASAGTKVLDDMARGVDDVASTLMEQNLRKTISEGAEESFKDVLTHNAKHGLDMTQDEMQQWAREIAAGKRIFKDGSWEKIDSYVGGAVGDKIVKVSEPVASRNFGTLKRQQNDYVQHVLTNRGEGRLGEVFTLGGARIGAPFGVRFQSRPAKLTQGAFEDWIGLRTLHKIPQGKVGKQVARVTPFIDAQNPFIQVARRRFDDADSPLNSLRIDELNWMQRTRMKAGHAARNDVALGQAFRSADELGAVMKKSGLSAEEIDEVWGMLFPSMQLGDVHPNMLSGTYADDVVEAFTKVQREFSTMLSDSYNTIKKYAPNTGHIDNYVPLVFSKDFQRLVRTMREAGAPFDGEDLEAGVRKLSRFLPDGEELTTEDLALFMEAYESMNSVAAGAARVGEAAPIRRRLMGRYLQRVDEGVEARITMGNFTEDGRAFADQLEMNESLNKVARAISESGEYTGKFGDDMDSFVTDPIKLLNDYVAEIASVSEQRAFLEAAKTVGAAKATIDGVNADHLMYNLGPLTAAERVRVEGFIANRRLLIEGLMNAPENPHTIHLGMGATIELADEIAEHPAMVKAIDTLKKQFGKLERSQNAFTNARKLKVNRLVQMGLDPDRADVIATVTDDALIGLRAEYEQAVQDAYLHLDETLTRTYFELAEDGRWGNEMLEAAKAQRDYVTNKAKNTWSSVERQYIDQMRAELPFTQDTLRQTLDPANQEQYTAIINELVTPIRERMQRNQEGMVGRLNEMVNDLDARRSQAQEKLDAFGVDKNDLGSKPESGHQRKLLEAEIRAATEDADYLWDIIEQVASANALDDELGVIAAAQATKMAHAEQARAVWSTWDSMIRDGIERRRLINPRIADEVEALWDDFEIQAINNQGSIVGAQLDNPHFWTVVADGIEADWESAADIIALDPAFFKGNEQFAASHISKQEIIDHLNVRIERAQSTVDTYARLRNQVGEGADYAAEDLALAKETAAFGVAEPERVARNALEKLELDAVGLAEGDPETLRRYMINHMAGRLEGQIRHGDLKAARVTNGIQVGESLVSAERAFQIVASAAYDPTLRDQLGWALDIVNSQLRKMPGGTVLREGKDGALMLVQEKGWTQKIPPLRYLVDGIESGQIDRNVLAEKGLGYLNGIIDVGEELKRVRAAVVSVRGATTRQQQKAALALEDFETLMDIIGDMLDGKSTAIRLRNFAREGTPTGQTRDSAALKRVKDVLAPEKQDQIDRLIQDAYMADARVSPQGRELLAQQDEAKIMETLFAPIEETFAKVERMTGELAQRAKAAQVEEHKLYIANAEEFIRQLTLIDEYRRAMPPAGTFVEQQANRVGDKGVETLEGLLNSARQYGARLTHDGPFTFETLFDQVTPYAGVGGVVQATDETTRDYVVRAADSILSRVGRGGSVVEDLGGEVNFHSLGVDGWVATDGESGDVMGAFIGESIGVAADYERRGIGKRLVQLTAKNRGYTNAVDFAKGFSEISEEGARVINSAFPKGARVKIRAKELGYTEATARSLYGGQGEIKRAIARSGATMSQEGMVRPAAFGLSGVIGGYDMDPMVAVIFRNMIDGQKYLYTPEGMGALRDTWHTFLRGWRGLATVSRPNFHLRNAMSGVSNGFLVGVGPKDYARVMPQYTRWRQALRGGATRDEALAVLDDDFRVVMESALEQNVLSDGFVRSDFNVKLGGGGHGLSVKPYDQRFIPTVVGGKTMESMEDVLRLSVFQKYLDPKYVAESGEFAREMTMMVHFDYQNLTQLERRFKTIAPFFIWTRRNVPLQLRALMEHPGNLQVAHHFSQAMNDNFGTEEYFDSPLPSFYGSLSMPLGVGAREGEENWMRFVFDPELPMSNLENLPFLDREETGALPINFARTLSPTAWISYMSELLGPQLSLPIQALVSEETGGFQTNAPVGLNEIGLLLENVDFFNVLNAEGEDWRWNETQKAIFDTALPFFKDFTGAYENTPSRAARLGTSNETGPFDPKRLLAEMMALTGSGAGLKTQVPHEAGAAAFQATEGLAGIRSDVKQRMGDNPLAFNENPETDLMDWALSLTNGG